MNYRQNEGYCCGAAIWCDGRNHNKQNRMMSFMERGILLFWFPFLCLRNAMKCGRCKGSNTPTDAFRFACHSRFYLMPNGAIILMALKITGVWDNKKPHQSPNILKFRAKNNVSFCVWWLV